MIYKSQFKKLKSITLPEFTGIRVLMLPILLEDIDTLPDDLVNYKETVQELIDLSPERIGVGYLTIDEKLVKQNTSHRLKGLHVDGVGTDGRTDIGPWARVGLKYACETHWDKTNLHWYDNAAGIGGMLTVSNPSGCRAWNKEFDGSIKTDGDCEHLRNQFLLEESVVFEPNMVYWCNATCVHESLPMLEDTQRTFVRLSMPSNAPWHKGYTRNPKGIQPSGHITNMREFTQREPEVVLNG